MVPARPTIEQRRKALSIVETTLDNAVSADYRTSVVIESALRVARLLGDYPAVLWLDLETRSVQMAHAKIESTAEVSDELGWELAKKLHDKAVAEYIEERTIRWNLSLHPTRADEPEAVESSPVSVIEGKIENTRAMIGAETDFGLLASLRDVVQSLTAILAHIRRRALRYLQQQESRLGLSDDVDALFDELRAQIDSDLSSSCPDGLSKFSAACSAFARREDESPSHALTSCRRLLKAVADAVYPPSDEPAIDPLGYPHVVDDAAYLNRLAQYVVETHPSGKSGASLSAEIGTLHDRLTKLNSVASKGVHDEVDRNDVRFTLVQTYIILGEVIRIGRA